MPNTRSAEDPSLATGGQPADEAIQWHALSEQDVAERLHTDPALGLEEAEVARRRVQYGSNELVAAPRPTFLKRLIAQFNDFIVIILIVAAILSARPGGPKMSVVRGETWRVRIKVSIPMKWSMWA